IGARNRSSLGSDDIRLLVNTGTHIAVAIENAQLHQKVRAAAAIEERERIAREMHDGVAQVLSYINVKTQAVKSFLDSGHLDATRAQLQELEDTCQEAYADVRESILGLRLATANTALVPALKEFISHFLQTSDLEVTLETDEDNPPALSPAHEGQIIRIVQEGLTNIRKHAVAKRAWVRLATTGNLFEVTITDNGKGFDASHLPKGEWPQFGLRTMKERAECINGTLDVVSAPGQGTKVELKVPVSGGVGL
ncbi:MAG: sensor histidine kinase, partial [Armatimonadetes bacterium]|nr:sensor histidine kinase [Armatimonadota bacterium]